MGRYVLYSPQTGLIRQVMDIADDEADLYEQPDGAVMPVTASPELERDYVLDGVVIPRPTLSAFDKTSIAADGIDTATLSGLPDPCTILINGQEHTVTGGTLDLDADRPGTYRVEIRHFPYRDFAQEITAT